MVSIGFGQWHTHVQFGTKYVHTISVQIEVGNDISKLGHNALAGSLTRRVWWTHVSRILSENVADGHLILDHLIIDLGLGDLAQILMRPSVAGDLMTLRIHTSDDICPVLI